MRTLWSLAVVAVAMAACSNGGSATNAAPAKSISPAKNTLAATSAPAPNPKLAQIFSPDVLGANVAWLETITGPAFRTEGSDRTYKVGGCTVIVGATAGKIDNIGIDGYGPACSFPIAQYFAGGYDYAVPRTPTFGDIKKGLGGVYGATCLHLCGNAADPLVMLTYRGSHADNFNDLYATVTINQDGPAMNAFTDWGDKLVAKHGAEYVSNGQYSDGDSLQAVAAEDFAKVSPTVIRVGQNLAGAD